jgi:hypothetical protein
MGRIEAGEPVRPWIMRMPTSPSPSEKGSAPGRTAAAPVLTGQADRLRRPGFTKSAPTM